MVMVLPKTRGLGAAGILKVPMWKYEGSARNYSRSAVETCGFYSLEAILAT